MEFQWIWLLGQTSWWWWYFSQHRIAFRAWTTTNAQCAFWVVRWPCIRYNKKKGWIQGHIFGEIADLEFGTHSFLMNHVFLPTEQAETNICWIIYQDASFKICLSLFGWKENIVPKMHIVHWWPFLSCRNLESLKPTFRGKVPLPDLWSQAGNLSSYWASV